MPLREAKKLWQIDSGWISSQHKAREKRRDSCSLENNLTSVGIPTHNQEKKNMTHNALIQSNIETAVVSLAPDANQRKQEVLTLSASVVSVTTPAELEIATARHRDIKRLMSEVETTRAAVKAPVLNLGRKIDQIAEEFCLALEQESDRIAGNPKKRIKGLIGVFVEAEQERVRKEQEAIEAERINFDK